MSEDTVTLTLPDAFDLVCRVLEASGALPENARPVAEALVAAEAEGLKGHGLSRVPSYAAQLRTGKVDGRATPQVTHVGNAALRIDAAHGFAYPALDRAIETLPVLVREAGIAIASITRSHHCGALGHHVGRLARKGLVGLMFANSPKAIAPWGGKRATFGMNTIALGAPRQGRPPLVVDLTLGKVARGKILLAKQRGEAIPEGWALDANGNPTTDPDEALQGIMLPIGDAKGAALVLMVEVLVAALGGANFGFEAGSFFTPEGEPPGVGQILIAIDPDGVSGGMFAERLESLIAEILGQPGARLPGDRRIAARDAARRDGFDIPPALLAEITALAEGR
ncbi:MAG: Ldh family oxidoreductase [Rhodospirillales bacterium]|nr:Ldh family oxidoreductase [Rhodospirillales bacterium]